MYQRFDSKVMSEKMPFRMLRVSKAMYTYFRRLLNVLYMENRIKTYMACPMAVILLPTRKKLYTDTAI